MSHYYCGLEVDARDEKIERLEAELAEWERCGVKLFEPCEHGETRPHMLAQKGMAQMVWTCGGRALRDGVQEIEWCEVNGIPTYADAESDFKRHGHKPFTDDHGRTSVKYVVPAERVNE